jgi:hypothetical protein
VALWLAIVRNNGARNPDTGAYEPFVL